MLTDCTYLSIARGKREKVKHRFYRTCKDNNDCIEQITKFKDEMGKLLGYRNVSVDMINMVVRTISCEFHFISLKNTQAVADAKENMRLF